MCNILDRHCFLFLLAFSLFCSICYLSQAQADSVNSPLSSNKTNSVSFVPSKQDASSTAKVQVPSSMPMHKSRERVFDSKLNEATLEGAKPVQEEPPQVDKEKPIVPKKGVSPPPEILPKANSNINVSSTNKTVHSKPIITESDKDYFEHNSSKDTNTLTIDQIDPRIIGLKDSTRSRYIIPIVAVIFSVPLVSILFSLLYKQGKDWWQHRKYKKMDFLVDGMYDN
ncbi:uncharacterized protein [Euwallacea similis]|uniref:uncharacterized protein n=1 Tax=Euwallacea similis TaxID=1736056 RepID=UPI003450805D